MELSSILGITAGVLSAIGWIIYNVDILRKKTRPNRSTWSILTFLGILIFFSYYDSGARDTIWVTLAYVLGPLLTALLSIFYYGEGGWTPFDKKCLLFVGISFMIWLAFRVYFPQIALPILIISLGIDFVGLLPTIKKSWENPRFENPPAWFLESLSSFINLFAITTWSVTIESFSIWIYPVYLFIINSVITTILLTSRYYLKRMNDTSVL